MDQFSYECDKCGKHSQFDFIQDCVVKVGEHYVKGTYDSHGGVKISVVSPLKGGKKRTITAYHEQFCKHFETLSEEITDETLLASEMYCNGKSGEGRHPLRSIHVMTLGGVDPHQAKDRHCCPNYITVQETLSASDLAVLPKVKTNMH